MRFWVRTSALLPLLSSWRFWHSSLSSEVSLEELRRFEGRRVDALELMLRNATPLASLGRVLVTRVMVDGKMMEREAGGLKTSC